MARSDALTLSRLGEEAVLERLLRFVPLASGHKAAGPGDDCAVIPQGRHVLLLKTDAVVEGVHFLPDLPPEAVGRKALNRAVSDIAAMGGIPQRALITIFSPAKVPVAYWEGVYRGMGRAARAAGVVIAGGEVSSASERAISVTLIGQAKHAVLRSGGRPGQSLYVTGRLGGSIRRKHWAFTPRLEEGQWLARRGFASAMMDLSDGLASDLPRLAAASGCGFAIERLPCNRGVDTNNALHDGEDYELLFAVPKARMSALEAAWKRRFPRLPLTRIGHLCRMGEGMTFDARGFDHFSHAKRSACLFP